MIVPNSMLLLPRHQEVFYMLTTPVSGPGPAYSAQDGIL